LRSGTTNRAGGELGEAKFRDSGSLSLFRWRSKQSGDSAERKRGGSERVEEVEKLKRVEGISKDDTNSIKTRAKCEIVLC
jgi:hypothetical protein